MGHARAAHSQPVETQLCSLTPPPHVLQGVGQPAWRGSSRGALASWWAIVGWTTALLQAEPSCLLTSPGGPRMSPDIFAVASGKVV